MRILILILSLSLSGCLTDSRINKQVAKATPERVMGLIQKNYPHLFTTRIDTIRDTVTIKTLRVDTVLTISQLRSTDTVTIYKDRLKTKMWIKHDSIFVESKCLGDTIYIEKVVYKDQPNKNYYQWWHSGLNTGFTLLILIVIAYVIYQIYKRFKPTWL